MSVSQETILDKMIQHINQAKKNRDNEKQFIQQLAKIQLLCELLLEDDRQSEDRLLSDDLSRMKGQTKDEHTLAPSIDEKEDGMSIFDF